MFYFNEQMSMAVHKRLTSHENVKRKFKSIGCAAYVHLLVSESLLTEYLKWKAHCHFGL